MDALSRFDPRLIQAALAAGNTGLALDDATKAAMLELLQNPAFLQQAQQANMQQNENYTLIQNAITAGIPTLDIPTITSYLGSGQPQTNDDAKDLASKYQKLLDTIQEMKRDSRGVYAASKGATERLRRQVNQAKQLIRECATEVENASKSKK